MRDEGEVTASEKKYLSPLNQPWLKHWLLAKKGKREDEIKEGGNDVLHGTGG